VKDEMMATEANTIRDNVVFAVDEDISQTLNGNG